MKPRSFLLLFMAFMATFSLHAQNWERLYTPGNVSDFTQTPDGGFLLIGDYDVWNDGGKAIITKTDAEGDVEWTRRYAVGDTLENYTALQVIDPQHIAAIGDYMIYADQPERIVPFFHLLDAQGHLLKEVMLDPNPNADINYLTSDIARTAQGELWIFVNSFPHPQNPGAGKIYACNTSLDLLWTADIPGKINQMIPLTDGTVLLCGSKNGLMYLCKTDAAGTILWEKTYQTGSAFATLTQDGQIVLAAIGQLMKVDPDGNVLWSNSGLPGFVQDNACVTEDHDGNLLVMGSYNANFTLVFTLGKFDADGNLIWKKTPHESMQGSWSNARPLVTSAGGYALAGSRAGKSMLILAESDFELYRSWIKGTMYHDQNDDCQKDADEGALKYFYVSATDANGSVWAEQVQNGAYAMQVPPGAYEVALQKRARDPENWDPCPAQLTTVTTGTDTAFIPALGIKSLVDCPRPSIRAGIMKVRQCHDNQYNLQYYNLGSEKATEVKITVELPDFFSYVGCSLPLVSQNGQEFTFLVGDLDIDEGGTATLDVFCSCDAELGDAACSTFRITPDTCFPTLQTWDHSIIKIDAEYDANDVSYTLENVGAGDMAAPLNYTLRSYCVSLLEEGTFQLNAGASQTITRPNNALAYLFEAEQPGNQPYIPGNAVALWHCQNAPVEEAWWHTETGSLFYDFNCEEVKSSFDPNDITVTPRGDGDEHFILATEPALTYRIRFQNTGNDTAFVVSIRDTLPGQTSILSVIPGPSSHPYSFDMHQNVLQFLFQDINLPDSSSHFDGSQGYVEFSVKMKPGLAPGTRIENKAAIYFDLNAPVVTNTAINTIHERVLVTVDIPEANSQTTSVRVAPNPTTDLAVFYFENTVEGVFHLLDASGREIASQSISGAGFNYNCQHLPAGVYYFKFVLKGQQPVQGKLLVTR